MRPYTEIRDLCMCPECSDVEPNGATDDVRAHCKEQWYPHVTVTEDATNDVMAALHDLANLAEDEYLLAALSIVSHRLDYYVEIEALFVKAQAAAAREGVLQSAGGLVSMGLSKKLVKPS